MENVEKETVMCCSLFGKGYNRIWRKEKNKQKWKRIDSSKIHGFEELEKLR